jgi:hypothetical protein
MQQVGICSELAENRLFFAFRPLNGKQNKNPPLRLCGEQFLL